MSDVKQVKVDNWGIYFLQRLKHFFNRTDYCDLTLQFQDNAQLKVHRLVLSACTEYFELLERTCEMYEDCLVMPDDLQADVVVPIVNFMYTGHLEFKMDSLERLYQTSHILKMPVLSKLLESHRNMAAKSVTHSYSGIKKVTNTKQPVLVEPKPVKAATSAGTSNKRSYNKAFENNVVYRDKKTYQSVSKVENVNNSVYNPPPKFKEPTSQKSVVGEPRPTRYEVPEELDSDNIFDNSFCSISYTSQPLMVHPETVKRYKAKRNAYNEASVSKKLAGLSTIDIVECKRVVPKNDHLFDDSTEDNFNEESELFNTYDDHTNNEKDSNQLFDQILDPNDGNDGPKVTIESKDNKSASNLDHARIISEVLKRYPHLVKSNKSIKLKILDPLPGKGKKKQSPAPPTYVEDKPFKIKADDDDFTYETDVIDSKQAAKLIAMGADNIKGPWICLICGTPGKALHFNSYYKFRRHLVEVHNEKPVANICEYCGLRSTKRNYLLHHLYAQHGVEPPPQYHFPKCNMCTYIALTDALLTKHKIGHKDIKNFRCNVCTAAFASSSHLLQHIQHTGHKYKAEKKSNLQCVYCMKVFLREVNLYSHIKTHHKVEAKTDGIIDDSDEEKQPVAEIPKGKSVVKFEPSTSFDNTYEEVTLQYPGQQITSVDKQVPAKRLHNVISNTKQKILNPGFSSPKPAPKPKAKKNMNQSQPVQNDIFQDIKSPMEPLASNQDEEVVIIDSNEYILRDHRLIPKRGKLANRDYIISDMVETDSLETTQQPTTSMEYTNDQNTKIEENVQQQQPSMVIKKSANLNQPIQIVVSNEEEYKALMASNNPIIFDDGGTNKTLTVLAAPHQNQAIETTAIDLNNTTGNEMVILPHEYPMNVSEAVVTENSNIVVVYSHPVDNQNKQFQILTSGGIEAQFVQSTAIITQNYETVTTTTPAMNTQCIETEVEQTWQNNIQSLEGQQIQLPAHTVMLDSNQIVTGPIHSATDNNLDQLAEVHLIPEPQKELSPVEANVTLNQSDVTIEQLDHPVEHDTAEVNNVPGMSLIAKETTSSNGNETVQIQSQAKSMPDIQSNLENIEEMDNILEQPLASENVMEQPMEGEFLQEQPFQTEIVQDQAMETENVINQPLDSEYVLEQPLVSANVMIIETPLEDEMNQTTVDMMEQQVETRSMTEQTENMIEHVETGNVLEQHIETGSPTEQPVVLVHLMEQPAGLKNVIENPVKIENVIEQPIETECLIEPSVDPQNLGNQTLNKFPEVKPKTDTSEAQEPEFMESPAYDHIVEINRADDQEPYSNSKVSEKIALDWSDDEYDVAEDGNRTSKSKSNESLQNQNSVRVPPQVEESIENIQQEMQNQMTSPLVEQNDIPTPDEDSSSQEMQLTPLYDSPVHTAEPNPIIVRQKLSSLLNDWEDNDSQEETITDSENIVESTAEESVKDTTNGSPEIPEAGIPKNANIKSLVSDWDDDEEEESK